MISLYRPGDSLVHRMPAAAKLGAVAAIALLVSLWPHTPVTAGAALAVVLALFAIAGFGPVVWAGQLWSLRWIVLLMALTQLVFSGPLAAAVNTTRVVSVVLLAGLLTLTTRSEDMLDTVERGLRPLRRLGVDPWRVAFTLSLAIALVPVVADFARRVREAQAARGVRSGIRAVVPLLVMSLRHADDVADALSARGIA
ncbi:energy-coupling factor transporter transmembrane protein EcfT [Microbacterium betulae]|uniref:Energy-coupling factor transporter transmembrane protein EcfT n=1 Tax=Microbacterium betulae TaxID=2981139 RepID=A0AA97FDY0_9MICO|nr:energy-coupling factor transporter transmembrane protein EcfT [Microbacterium sp. AB]WOF21726.1 energy-coupling factor transporter transmembrane protein EcfT [Microbacterium sp. AB]